MTDLLAGGLGLVGGFSILIFVHELGHYLLAKWNGVRVHVFSLGMGPYLVSFTWGETLYVFSLVPIGGYVKMAGQDDMQPDLTASADPGDYRNKRPGQRAAILAAGAAFNLIFALFMFTCCYYYGVNMKGMAPIVGDVLPQTPIGQARALIASGESVPRPLQRGDRITSVNGMPVKTMMELGLEVASSGKDSKIWLNYERDGDPVLDPVYVETAYNAKMGAATIGMSPSLGYTKEHAYPVGFSMDRRIYVRADPKEDTAAGKAGLKKDDLLVELDGVRLDRIGLIIKLVNTAKGEEQTLTVLRGGKRKSFKLKGRYEKKDDRYLLGIVMREGPVDQIDSRCEAYAQGLRKGDFIKSFRELRSETELEIGFSKSLDDPVEKFIVIPNKTNSGSKLACVKWRPEDVIVKEQTFVEALSLAWSDVIRYSKSVFNVVRALVTGRVSVKSVSGPVGIGTFISSVAVQHPLMYYLWFLAFLSVNLGVFQFIPIPLLDGWHLVMIGVEKLKGSPVSPKVQIAFQYVGLCLILGLILLATSNDLLRLFSVG